MFVAGLASLIPAPAVCHNSSAKSAVASDLLQKLMLVCCLLVLVFV